MAPLVDGDRMKRRKLTPQERSRSASQRGRDLEAAVDLVHRRYRNTRMAYPMRNHPEVRIHSRRRGTITGTLRSAGEPDYSVLAGGHTLLFDAKRTAGEFFPLKNIELHQAEALTRAGEQGAFVFLLVQTVHGRYVLPWEKIAERYRRYRAGDYKRATGATRVSAAELVAWSVVSFRRADAPDYLAAVLLHLSK